MKKTRYWFNPKISWKVFKKVCDKFPDSGPTPKSIYKVLWGMLRSRKINIGIENSDDPIFITTNQIPKNAILIGNPAPKPLT